MLIFLILIFLEKDVSAYSQLRNHIGHRNYGNARLFDHNIRRNRYNGMDYSIRHRYNGIDNGIEANYPETDYIFKTGHDDAENYLETEYTEPESYIETKYNEIKDIQSSSNDFNEFSSLGTPSKKNTLLADIVELIQFLETRLPTQLSEITGLFRAIYILIYEAFSVSFSNLPKDISILNDIFRFISSMFSGTLVESIANVIGDGQGIIEEISNRIGDEEGIYSIPQKVVSEFFVDGTFSSDLVAGVGKQLLEVVTSLISWTTEMLENITPLLNFEEIAKISKTVDKMGSLNGTSDFLSSDSGDMYEAYQNTLKLYPKLDELTSGTIHQHLSKSLFKVITKLLKLIYKSN